MKVLSVAKVLQGFDGNLPTHLFIPIQSKVFFHYFERVNTF